jgi:oxygen-dependent protoporphyrinogen oxidase
VKRIVVIGGGISGLAAARAAAEGLGGASEVLVLEKEARVGGKALTAVEGDWKVELGPAGFLAPDPAIDRLTRAAGIERELQPADEAAARRFLVRGGRMREVSAHPARFVSSGILGPLGILRVLAEPMLPGRTSGDGEGDADESVWSFARRRLGRQAADRLVAPMVLGVFAGDARRLSLPAAFPRLAELEAQHGSLVRGMIASRRRARTAASVEPGGANDAASSGAAPSGGPAGAGGRLTSFRDGLETLPRALARAGGALGIEVRTRAAVEAVERDSDGMFLVRSAGETIRADALVLASEAWVASRLLAALAPGLASELAKIAYPPVAVVALGFDAAAARGVPHGFGVLVPRGEGFRVLGVLWDSYIFPGRSPGGTVLMRAMLGGAVDPTAGSADEANLIAWTLADLRRLLAIQAPPTFTRVQRWEHAIPQYELGHLERVRRIEVAAARQPGLFLAGNALHGVAFGKAAAAGLAAGEAAASFVARGA